MDVRSLFMADASNHWHDDQRNKNSSKVVETAWINSTY